VLKIEHIAIFNLPLRSKYIAFYRYKLNCLLVYPSINW